MSRFDRPFFAQILCVEGGLIEPAGPWRNLPEAGPETRSTDHPATPNFLGSYSAEKMDTPPHESPADGWKWRRLIAAILLASVCLQILVLSREQLTPDQMEQLGLG